MRMSESQKKVKLYQSRVARAPDTMSNTRHSGQNPRSSRRSTIELLTNKNTVAFSVPFDGYPEIGLETSRTLCGLLTSPNGSQTVMLLSDGETVFALDKTEMTKMTRTKRWRPRIGLVDSVLTLSMKKRSTEFESVDFTGEHVKCTRSDSHPRREVMEAWRKTVESLLDSNQVPLPIRQYFTLPSVAETGPYTEGIISSRTYPPVQNAEEENRSSRRGARSPISPVADSARRQPPAHSEEWFAHCVLERTRSALSGASDPPVFLAPSIQTSEVASSYLDILKDFKGGWDLAIKIRND